MTVVVVGSVNIDLVVHTPLIAPPGQTVIATGSGTGPGGKGGNQAAAVAHLGGACRLIAAVGPDFDPSTLPGVDLSLVRTTAEPTGLAVVMLDPSGENAITVVPGANALLSPEDTGSFTGPPGVLLASLEVPLPAVTEAARAAREAGWTVVLNPAPARALPASLLADVDVLVPNEHELAALGAPDDLIAAGVGAVVVTLGAAGCRIHRPGDVRTIPAHPVQAVDTTGAGDAFCGALAWALDTGRDLDTAVRFAVVAGALATRAVGARAALATAAEVTAQ
ncbi:ribokinase [Dactylosporangium siamense]|uniref:Ribokinase n=1 Tax=Dactylosporangium siamense TaxID=685454 RepID=A0A919U7V4_9ACTN|nr:ribokinase [Dactylosporangium siamense]GIG45027.1 ribokinase [Dactylosporangium siamense]